MYATALEILGTIQPLRPTFTVSNINTVWQSIAAANINKNLVAMGIQLPATDYDDFLKNAEICLYMELACMNRIIESVVGDVLQEKMGRYEKQYSKSMPMFFFAKGPSTPFLHLLPHETWRMQGYSLVDAYVWNYFYRTETHAFPTTTVTQNTAYDWASISTGEAI